MEDFDITFDKPERMEEERLAKMAKVTPIVGGKPTNEELFEAFDRMFREEWRKNQ